MNKKYLIPPSKDFDFWKVLWQVPQRDYAGHITAFSPSSSLSSSQGFFVLRILTIWQSVLTYSFQYFLRSFQLARKEAIYRQMLMYKRLHSQATTKYHKSEKEKNVLDGQARSVEVCWTQVREGFFGVFPA